jgi:hypothetical protein
VFRDFVEMSALAISNAVDLQQCESREARYREIIKTYDKDEASRMSFALACVVECLEAGITDCLGSVFMSMELGSHWHGQYFTPWPLCSMMARMVAGDCLAALKDGGQEFVTVSEPAAGSGAMVLAFADAMRAENLNYQEQLHATLVDVDVTIPAIVTHGSTLSLETWSTWRTPAHVIGFWGHKLARRERQAVASLQAEASIDGASQPILKAALRPSYPADVALPSQLTLL